MAPDPCSMRPSDVDIGDLIQLYRLAAQPYLTQGGWQRRQHYEHWTTMSGEQRS